MSKIYSYFTFHLILIAALGLRGKAQLVSQTFSYTGSIQTLTVPACVAQISVIVDGASGSNGASGQYASVGGSGGLGARVSGIYTFSVAGTRTLHVVVGQQGQNATGGYNGGGPGGTVAGAGGGGGASDIRFGGTSLANRIIVAGGGGGGGSASCSGAALNGGNGGNGGGNGLAGGNSVHGGGGAAGTGSVGGTGGTGCTGFIGSSGGNGLPGQGGSGGTGTSVIYCSNFPDGGGGGGGFIGGGGGGAGSAGVVECWGNSQGTGAGGAGGSNYFSAGFTNTVVTSLTQTGNGQVVISYSNTPLNVAVSNATVCSGKNATLTVSGASTYTWSGAQTSASIVVSPTSTTNYSVLAEGIPGCTTAVVATVSVNALPTVSIGNYTLCSGGSFTLNPSGAHTYTYSSGTPVIPLLTNTVISITGTDLNGCLSQNTAVCTISVNPTPTLNVNNAAVCLGASVTLSVSGAHSYTWTGSNYSSTMVVSPNTSTSYTVSGASAAGCTKTTSAFVAVLPLPTVSIGNYVLCSGGNFTLNPSGANTYTYSSGTQVIPLVSNTVISITGKDLNGCPSQNTAVCNITVNPSPTLSVNHATICAGTSVVLNAFGASSYTWSTTQNSTNIAVSPTTTTNYTVLGQATNGCTNQAIASVSVIPRPTVSIGNYVFCSGGTFTLNPSGAATYTYSSGTPVITLLTNTIISIVGTDLNGCVSQNTAVCSISVNPTPTLSVNQPTICWGTSVVLNALGASSYTWSGGQNSASIVVSPTTTSSYTVSGESAGSCTTELVSTVVVNPLPTVSIGNYVLCSGGHFTLHPSGALTYTYSSGTPVIPLLSNTVVSITGTDLNGCVSQNTAVCNITVNPSPTITVNSGSVCAGQSFVLLATGASSYSYSSGSASLIPTGNTTVSVTGTSTEGCQGVAISTLVVYPLPVLDLSSSQPTICAGETVILTATGASSFVWSSGDTGSSVQVSPVVTTVYTLSGTDSNGCSSSVSFTQQVDVCEGIEVIDAADPQVIIYPNPNNGGLRISSQHNLHLTLYNEVGQVVQSMELNSANRHQVELSGLSKGIYFISYQNLSFTGTKKIVVTE